MSELKAHKAYNRWIDEEMPTPNDDLICNEVYLKSEADKVIADLEERHKKEVGQLVIETKRLENLCASYRHDCDNLALREANALKEIGRDNRVIRHQKYKRCYAMYRYCSIKALYELDFKGNDVEWKWYSKWMHKWFDLAKKFKETK